MRLVGGGRKLAALFWLMLPRGCGCAGGSFRQLVVRVLGPKRPRSARGTIPKRPPIDTPTAKLVRQVLGAISEFDKAMTVAKLRGARERKRRDAGKCEGRKSHAELNPALVATAKRLRRQKPKGGRMSLRAIAAELEAQGYLNERGRRFSAASVQAMLNE
jgi:DNA invertase Pin-like site-specific DNA recombinase